MVCIIIINWNGYHDTIDCLRSLDAMSYDDYFVIIGDNGSTDDSLAKLENYCLDNHCDYLRISLAEEKKYIPKKKIILYELGENYGFSRGNNLILEYANLFHPDYYLLLNNDTIVEPDFLFKLVQFHKRHSNFKALTPLIHYFYDKNKIWNGGGNIYWGFRKYHYADKLANTVKENDYIPCTYITGCALFFVPNLLMGNMHLFTEKYFFGEEDFELCLRLKKQSCKLACVVDSVIYHKVGASRKRESSRLGHAYVYYLNRLMDVKDYMNSWQFNIYRMIFYINIFLKLKLMYNLNFYSIAKFCRLLQRDLRIRNSVTKDYCLYLFDKNSNMFH